MEKKIESERKEKEEEEDEWLVSKTSMNILSFYLTDS